MKSFFILTLLLCQNTLAQISQPTLNSLYLYPCAPSVTADVTNIQYFIPVEGFVKLTLFDLLGRSVLQIVNQIQINGDYSKELNLNNLPAGMYLLCLVYKNQQKTQKVFVIK